MSRALLAILLALLAAGCGPRNYRACMAQAAEKPTDTGVRLAVAECGRQFPEEVPPTRRIWPPEP